MSSVLVAALFLPAIASGLAAEISPALPFALQDESMQ